jgi:hypothetical protein
MGNTRNKLRQSRVFRLGPTLRSTLANEPLEDRKVEPLLEEPVEKFVVQ